MISFIICLALLIGGYFVYGKVVENTFAPDDRETPAVRINDGVDYVVMPQWKLFLVQLLNIAAFHLSFTVLYAIGHWVVFRVGGWSPRIPTRFHVSGRTLELAQLLSFSPTWFSHSLTGLPMPFG